jgi:hypothetical protein
METEVVFRKLAQRFSTFELDGELSPHRDRLTLRAPSSVRLKMPAMSTSQVPLSARPAGDDAQWRAAYRRQLDEQPPELDEIERHARIAVLQRVPFFRPCTDDELATLAATAYTISFDPGEHLCVEGAEAPDCYVIATGEADVVIGGTRRPMVGADDVVGERGLVLGTTRAASVTATSHMITHAISRELLQTVFDRSPTLADAMRTEVLRRYA